MKILFGQHSRNIQIVFLKVIKVKKIKDKEDLQCSTLTFFFIKVNNATLHPMTDGNLSSRNIQDSFLIDSLITLMFEKISHALEGFQFKLI